MPALVPIHQACFTGKCAYKAYALVLVEVATLHRHSGHGCTNWAICLGVLICSMFCIYSLLSFSPCLPGREAEAAGGLPPHIKPHGVIPWVLPPDIGQSRLGSRRPPSGHL